MRQWQIVQWQENDISKNKILKRKATSNKIQTRTPVCISNVSEGDDRQENNGKQLSQL